jgi:uncharacterized Ntn-hydrolase superfamily protein
MGIAFETSDEMFANRLVRALEAGQEAGGDVRGMQSAALLVVRDGGGPFGYGDRYIDLRVDDHQQPIAELKRLLNLSHTYHMITTSRENLEKGDVESALKAARQAVWNTPSNENAHLELAVAYYLSGDKRASFDELQEAIKLNPNIIQYVERVPRYRCLKNDEKFQRLVGCNQ